MVPVTGGLAGSVVVISFTGIFLLAGKTLLVETISKCLNVPFASVDCNSLTSAGYVGEDVESAILRLYQNANCNLEQTEKGMYQGLIQVLGEGRN